MMTDVDERMKALLQARVQRSGLGRGADRVWAEAFAGAPPRRRRRRAIAVAVAASIAMTAWVSLGGGEPAPAPVASGGAFLWTLPDREAPQVEAAEPATAGGVGTLEVWRRDDAYVVVGRTEPGESTVLDVFPLDTSDTDEHNGLRLRRPDVAARSVTVAARGLSDAETDEVTGAVVAQGNPGPGWTLVRSGPDRSPFAGLRTPSTTLHYRDGAQVTTVDVAHDPQEILWFFEDGNLSIDAEGRPVFTTQAFAILFADGPDAIVTPAPLVDDVELAPARAWDRKAEETVTTAAR